MATLVTAVPTLQQQVAAVAAGGAGNPALLEGDSDSTASASLQERLQVIFMQAGVPLNSVETLPGEAAGDYPSCPFAHLVQRSVAGLMGC